jgi:hypothetical protein
LQSWIQTPFPHPLFCNFGSGDWSWFCRVQCNLSMKV